MKLFTKSVKVVFDAHLKSYQLYYKKWFVWHYDSSFKYDDPEDGYPIYFVSQDQAKERAIARGNAMLKTHIVWSKSE